MNFKYFPSRIFARLDAKIYWLDHICGEILPRKSFSMTNQWKFPEALYPCTNNPTTTIKRYTFKEQWARLGRHLTPAKTPKFISGQVTHKTDIFAPYLIEFPLYLCWQFNMSKQGQKEKRWQGLSVSKFVLLFQLHKRLKNIYVFRTQLYLNDV